jgi:hypothetical protein
MLPGNIVTYLLCSSKLNMQIRVLVSIVYIVSLQTLLLVTDGLSVLLFIFCILSEYRTENTTI